ncbi:MAG: Fur family transcriptional regulator [Planctomycetota bacterium]
MSDLAAIAVDVTPSERFREYLATQGMRLTRERAIIVDEVFASHEHFDAEQLVARLVQRTDGSRVSRSTVYRALAELEKAGLLRKVARTNDREIYEHDYGYPQHDHLICKKCGELTEFQNPEVKEILQQVAAAYGFRMEGHRLEVSGICANCSRPPSRGHRKLDMI